MTPKQLRAFRKRHGLTQGQLAEKLGVLRWTVLRWESGKHPISRMAENLIRLIDQQNN